MSQKQLMDHITKHFFLDIQQLIQVIIIRNKFMLITLYDRIDQKCKPNIRNHCWSLPTVISYIKHTCNKPDLINSENSAKIIKLFSQLLIPAFSPFPVLIRYTLVITEFVHTQTWLSTLPVHNYSKGCCVLSLKLLV